MRSRSNVRFLLVSLSAALLLTSVHPAAAGVPDAVLAGIQTSVLAGTARADGPSPDDNLLPAADLDGTPIAPDAKSVQDLTDAQRPVQAPSLRSLAMASPARLGSFAASNDKPGLEVPQDWRPYARLEAGALGAGTRDATGVPMYKIGSTLYDHPVRQAQDGLLAVESYRINQDPRQLAQAELDAQRLLDRKVQREAGVFFPYPFDFALHGKTADTIRAPWYSGMAQGLALSLFSRLADATGDPSWRLAADETFASLLLPPDPTDLSLPFVSWVDSENHLWIDEYAQQPLTRSDKTFNGHNFAVYGLWDYHRISQNPAAATMFAGALETVRYHIYRDWRTAFWISRYCLTHGPLDLKYHQVHVMQLRQLHSITGNSNWSVWSDRFRDDYPNPQLARTVKLAAGIRMGYKFDSAGRVLGSRGITLSRGSAAPASARTRIRNRPYYYLITAGSLSGYWVQERVAAAYVPGLILSTAYPYPRTAMFAVGRHTGWSMTASGLRAGARTISLSHISSASFDRSGWIDGASYVHIINGSLVGRWVPTSGLTLR